MRVNLHLDYYYSNNNYIIYSANISNNIICIVPTLCIFRYNNYRLLKGFSETIRMFDILNVHREEYNVEIVKMRSKYKQV